VQPPKRKLAIPYYRCQQIIEVVRYSTRQPSNRFHLLRVAELLFEVFAFGDIRYDHHAPIDLTSAVDQRRGGETDVDP
jgi:hypothetical protein